MKIRRAVVKDLISNLAVFALPFSITSVVYFIVYGIASPILWVLVVPFLFMYVIRKKVKGIYVFIIAHISLAAVFGLIFWNHDVRWFVITFLTITGMFSCYLKTRDEIYLEKAFSAVLIILFICLFFLLRFSQVSPEPVQIQLVFIFLATKCLGVLHTHMDNVDYRLNILAKVSGYKDLSGKIISVNNTLIFVFVGNIFILGLLMSFGTNLLQLLNAFGDAIAGIFGWFTRLYQQSMNFLNEVSQRNTQEVAPELVYTHVQERVEELAEFIEDIEYDQYANFDTMQMVLNVVGALIFIIVASVVIKQFYKYFHKKQEDAGEEANTDTVISLDKTVVSDLMELLPRFRTKLRNPIRRAYAKKVKQHIRAGVEINTSDTTDIIANKIRTIENIDELTAKYEQARYGK